ncbi:hypothetical protein KKG71_05445, partial [Patescibacteria group bacterium]|nr:hypothetical protein [Patescibacteria group bacterium]
MKKSELILGILRIPFDLIATFLAFILAYELRLNYPDLLPGLSLSSNLEVFQPRDEYTLFAIGASLFLMIIFALNRLYSFKVDSTLQNELLKVALAVLSWLMLILAYFFIIREPFFSRLVIGYTLLFTIILVSLGRSIIRIVESILLNKNIGKRRVLIIGANNITQTLYNHFKKDKRFTVVGVLANTKKPSTATYRILGSLKELANIVKLKKVDELIQTKSDLNEAEAIDILDFCREKHLEYSFVPDI